MKFFHILISFALVNDLVALDDYTKQVIMTNQQMILVKDSLPIAIQNIVLYGKFTMAELALMLAVPEADIEAQDKDIIDYIVHKKIDYQIIVQEKIWCSTSIRAPEINESLFENADLKGLGNNRRSMTLEAIKTLIRDVISGDNKLFEDIFDMCRLIGLLRSIQYPEAFIQHADVDERGVCFLADIHDTGYRYFKIDNNIWEFNLNGTSKELLSSQVKK